jgi:thiol-disulfide isomerase/thioredoxin
MISCTQEKNRKQAYAVVSGKILGGHDGTVTISDKMGRYEKELQVDSLGQFTDTLQVSGIYGIRDGKNTISIYLENGDELRLNYKSDNFDASIEFSGNTAHINRYMQDKATLGVRLRGEGSSIYKLEEEAYLRKINAIEDAFIGLLDSSKVSETFRGLEKKNIGYTTMMYLKRYPRYHAHYAQKPDFKVSENWFDPTTDLDKGRVDDYYFSAMYRRLLEDHYNEEVNTMMEKDSTRDYALAGLEVLGFVKNDTIRNALIYNKARYEITYTGDLKTYYETFTNLVNDSLYLAKMAQSYNDLEKVSAGKPSPKFVDYENYKGGKTSLDDLKGRYVYIDVWATWCGPCIREIPALKKLETDYHTKNIEFVSISVDVAKSHGKWRDMVADKDLKGVQLFAPNAFESDFVKNYKIMGIPRFILIDPDGNIMNSNAPRPSSAEIRDIFNGLEM